TVANELPALDRQVEALRNVLLFEGGLSHAELDNLGYQLLQQVTNRLSQEASTISMPGVYVSVVQGSRSYSELDDQHRPLMSQGWRDCGLAGQVNAPADASAERLIHVSVRKDPTVREVFRLWMQGDPTEWLDIRLDDVTPEYSSSFQLRLSAWIRGVLES